MASLQEGQAGERPAWEVCIHGRRLSDDESDLASLHTIQSFLLDAMKYPEVATAPVRLTGREGKTVPLIKHLRMGLKRIKKKIADKFFKAIDEDDAEKIIELAQAVIFLKDKRPRPLGEEPHYEARERALLLMAKEILVMRGEKWTVKEVAQYLAGSTDIPTPDDGFSALRRKCRQLGLPLASARQIKRKDPLEFLRNFVRLD